jgi:hypothetical protein
MTPPILITLLWWQAILSDIFQLAQRALAGAAVLAIVALVFDQVCRRLWYQWRIGGKYHESNKPERKIRVRYRRQLTFRATCTENGAMVWTSVFTYDRLARLGVGNYSMQTIGANTDCISKIVRFVVSTVTLVAARTPSI